VIVVVVVVVGPSNLDAVADVVSLAQRPGRGSSLRYRSIAPHFGSAARLYLSVAWQRVCESGKKCNTDRKVGDRRRSRDLTAMMAELRGFQRLWRRASMV
jgi:hypothetical protein